MEIRPHIRLLHGMRRPANWLQLVRFGIVGGVGFVVNLAVYTPVRALRWASTTAPPRLPPGWSRCSTTSFSTATGRSTRAADRAHFQAVRFLLVSLAAEAFSLLLLTLFVEVVGIAKVPAQALAVAWLDAAEFPRQQAMELSRREAEGHGPPDAAMTAASGHCRRSSGYLYSGLSPSRRTFVQEMVIYGVSFDMVGKQPIVLLKTVDGNKFLPIWIGHPEAASILMKLQGAGTPRPMTHDLLCDILGELDVKCTQVSVTELRENTFFASITPHVDGRELEIDSRPSDAIALAVRSGAPIYAAEEVISESAIEFEHDVEESEDVVEKFKEFLDQVSPEDFAAGDS